MLDKCNSQTFIFIKCCKGIHTEKGGNSSQQLLTSFVQQNYYNRNKLIFPSQCIDLLLKKIWARELHIQPIFIYHINGLKKETKAEKKIQKEWSFSAIHTQGEIFSRKCTFFQTMKKTLSKKVYANSFFVFHVSCETAKIYHYTTFSCIFKTMSF